MLVRIRAQWLFDEKGVGYLDTRNNVPHVGHSHPHVAQAVAKQARLPVASMRRPHHKLARALGPKAESNWC